MVTKEQLAGMRKEDIQAASAAMDAKRQGERLGI